MATKMYRGAESGSSHESHSEMSKQPKGYTPAEISVEQADNGGFIVRCHYRPEKTKGGDLPGYMEPKTYAVESLDAAMTVARSHFGEKATS